MDIANALTTSSDLTKPVQSLTPVKDCVEMFSKTEEVHHATNGEVSNGDTKAAEEYDVMDTGVNMPTVPEPKDSPHDSGSGLGPPPTADSETLIHKLESTLTNDKPKAEVQEAAIASEPVHVKEIDAAVMVTSDAETSAVVGVGKEIESGDKHTESNGEDGDQEPEKHGDHESEEHGDQEPENHGESGEMLDGVNPVEVEPGKTTIAKSRGRGRPRADGSNTPRSSVKPKTPRQPAQPREPNVSRVDREGDGEGLVHTPAGKSLFDSPLEVSGKRERKTVERWKVETPKSPPAFAPPDGTGLILGDIEYVNHQISYGDINTIKFLHHLCFGYTPKSHPARARCRLFKGFEFQDKETSKYQTKLSYMKHKMTMVDVKNIAHVLGIAGTHLPKDELSDVVLSYLMKPTMVTLAIPDPPTSGRPRPSSSRKSTSSSRKSGTKRGRKSSSKPTDGATPGADESAESAKTSVKKRGRTPSKKPAGGASTSKTTVKKRGRTSSKKPAADKASSAEESAVSAEENASSAESESEQSNANIDSPPAKRAKTSPAKAASPSRKSGSSKNPSDADLEKYIKDLLKDADLDKVTMKSVTTQVAAKYPSMNVAERKNFIKETVRIAIAPK